jgi:RimJ/RimL family protein N-acetyltransferase
MTINPLKMDSVFDAASDFLLRICHTILRKFFAMHHIFLAICALQHDIIPMNTTRLLTPAEHGLYRDHLLRLSPDDRRLRFCAPLDDDAIIEFVAGLSPWETRIIACFDDRLAVIAAVQITVIKKRLAEFAFSVDEAERGRGLATTLMRRALLWVRNRNIPRAHMHCLAENHAVRRMGLRLGMSVSSDTGDGEAAIALPPPTPLSIAQELAAEQVGLWDYLLKAGLRLAMPQPSAPRPQPQL